MIAPGSRTRLLVLALLAAAASPLTASAMEVYLRADTTTVAMPGSVDVVMWGFAQDSAFGALDGTVTVPGPPITLAPGDPNLTIHLDNNLSVPVSVVIPGLPVPGTPVRNLDGRARSFTHETPPGNLAPVDYAWTDVAAGTHIYHSGTHPAVQVQMGLYGALTKDAAAGEAYTGVAYDAQVTLFYSAIDPALHEAVATGNYGPGLAMTSTVDYKPHYFLVNGDPYEPGDPPILAGSAGDRVLVRFLNADIMARAPVILGTRMSVVAEDGYPYSYPRDHYALLLPALQTKDAVIEPDAGTYPVFDHALGLTNAQDAPGGMYTHLEIAP
jgi:FtsP/CotA-like multicopper oxidase with cupredoxin domain